mgnify:CR=1 FL=1
MIVGLIENQVCQAWRGVALRDVALVLALGFVAGGA